ncbi:MAG: DUF3298 domain-containing protein [Bacteroidales bacterium]|nr:DUF3298 domain-containing protein [Bacteroidales bacterium]
MKKLVFTFVAACITIILFSQDYACSFSYKHMSGLVGGDKIIVDLIISGSDISGNCTFPEKLVEEGALAGMVQTQRLEGSIDEHGVASILAYSQNIESGEYSGMLDEMFKGTYREHKSSISRSFIIEDDYSSGSIAFNGYCISRDSVLLDTIDSPLAHITLSLLLPKDDNSTAPLKAAIMKAFFGQQMIDSVPDDSILYVYSNNYFRKYLDANIDIYDGGYSFNWEMIATSYININTDGILVYRADNFAYTGGAHGMGISRFLVFDNKEMKQLALDEIFDAGYEDELSKLLERKYRMDYYLGPEQSLTEAGLFENHIPLSDNFYLTTNSIGFYYNPYELAPYSMGAISINLTYEEILPLMKIDSPVMRMIK